MLRCLGHGRDTILHRELVKVLNDSNWFLCVFYSILLPLLSKEGLVSLFISNASVEHSEQAIS